MAPKSTSGTPAGSTKIRFVLLEVDSTDGNLSEITHAITNAVRPSLAVPKVPALPPGAPPPVRERVGAAPVVDLRSEEEVADEDTALEVQDGDGAGGRAAPRTPRKYPMPTYLADLELEKGDVAFKAFAQQKAPKKRSKKYLTIAAWFKEYGDKQAITINDVYTCYRTAGWGTNVTDWDMAFRQLVKRDWMRRVRSGEYAITPLGENEVNTPGA